MLLAIVVPIGTVILVNGTTEINAFNNEITNTLKYKNEGIQEDLVFEHIRFEPTTTQVMISIRNAGSVETTIDRITLVNMTNQDLLYKIDVGTFNPVPIALKNSTDIYFTVDPADMEGNSWDSAATLDGKEYKISIITTRGNFFDTVARPFNT